MNARVPATAAVTSSVLYLDDVTVSFDGFRALSKLSFYLQPGELRAVIGPNGAGKTTMMDVITGKTRPDSGEVYFGGKVDLTRLDESAIANLGIGRKFQKPTVFETQTVDDNLRLALKDRRGVRFALFSRTSAAQAVRLDELLATIGLTDQRDTLAGLLSHGQKQWLEIGMLLAQEPQLLLMDEPAAGMTDAETEATAKLLRAIARDHSLVVVEHALEAKVTVLHEGSVLAEGSMEHVQAHPRVIEVYLGR
jgi:urea transport system ATP-binding protein